MYLQFPSTSPLNLSIFPRTPLDKLAILDNASGMKKLLLLTTLFPIAFLTFQSAPAQAAGSSNTYVSLEGALAWQTQNDQAIPGKTGTRFSLSDISRGPFNASRVYLGYAWGRHEVRALYAPLAIELNTRFASSVSFMDTTFAADTDTTAFYKFNSYRLTYTYFLNPSGGWNLAWGFTAKIRDAEVRLTQGATVKSKTNIGFVPLLNFRASRSLGTDWTFRFDLDGLAAPQGRAFDAALFVERKLSQNFAAFGGYRTVEGGASNDEVYNFAWLHFLTVGARGEF